MPNPLLEAQNYVSGWFRAIPIPGGTSCEIGFWGAYNAPLYASEVESCFSQRTCPIHFFRPKTKFLGGLAQFRCREVQVVDWVLGCIQCTTLCFRSCVLFFRNKHAQSTCLGPKLSFWVVSCD